MMQSRYLVGRKYTSWYFLYQQFFSPIIFALILLSCTAQKLVAFNPVVVQKAMLDKGLLIVNAISPQVLKPEEVHTFSIIAQPNQYLQCIVYQTLANTHST